MANPFLGETNMGHPRSLSDHYGDDSAQWFGKCRFHVAGILLLALGLLVALQMSGFRAVVGIGRG